MEVGAWSAARDMKHRNFRGFSPGSAPARGPIALCRFPRSAYRSYSNRLPETDGLFELRCSLGSSYRVRIPGIPRMGELAPPGAVCIHRGQYACVEVEFIATGHFNIRQGGG